MKFKVGDKVRVKKNLKDIEKFSHGYMPNMESFEGKIVTIEYVTEEWVMIEEDTHHCDWDFRAFEPINKKPTKEELLEMPMGTKITTDAKEDNVFVKTDNGIYGTIDDREDIETAFYNEAGDEMVDDEINDDLSLDEDLTYGTKIIKIEVPTYETVYDSSEEVKEMTMDEICKALGYNVKIIKEEN